MRSWFAPVCALLFVVAAAPSAQAGPKRLTAALEALRNSEKQLEDAKEPPAVFHDKSLAAVRQAIAAVEREIKAYNDAEAKAKAKADAPKDGKADPKGEAGKADKAKAADPKNKDGKAAAPAKPAAKPAPKPKAEEETVD